MCLALHYAYVGTANDVKTGRADVHRIMNGSTDVLEHILDHESCNPDVRNRLGGDTPLHIAVRQRWEDQPGMRLYLGECDLVRRLLPRIPQIKAVAILTA